MGLTRPLLLAAALTALSSAFAHAQISPGPLSRFHQALEGARNCGSCHAARGVTRALCLTCHTALGGRIASGRGLHARPEYQVGCERCHVEHQGRGFELVFWGQEGRAAFDHAQAGFPLQGRHAALSCEGCHTARRIRDPAALSRGGVNLARTFLGLERGCASCHTDPHKGQFAPRGCADCHGQERWKPVARFDHARTNFTLTGRHAPLACTACHTAQPNGAVRFAGTPHATCASCHRDPHAGRMGGQCATCHVTEGWSRIEEGRVDHDRTRFPLTGRHERVACARCHAARPGGGLRFQGTPFQGCSSCHQDPHGGRLGTQCATCHTTAGWDRVAEGRFDHARTRFPLLGRHARVACDDCHPAGRPPAPRAHAQCTDCHRDRHAGQLASRPDGGRCESCHSVEGFTPARFSIEDHARTRAPLTGAHLAVPCDACHREVAAERLHALGFTGARGETEQLRFRTACGECHADPHRGQSARWGSCEACHRTSAWPDIGFDHVRTRFPLAGAHATTPCRACHPGEGGALALAGRPAACAGCHRDPHDAQFARAGVTECARCHDPSAWRSLRFDHGRDTGFPLEGAHRAVACAGCHLRQTAKGPAMRYSGLGKACSDCHGAQGAPRGEGR